MTGGEGRAFSCATFTLCTGPNCPSRLRARGMLRCSAAAAAAMSSADSAAAAPPVACMHARCYTYQSHIRYAWRSCLDPILATPTATTAGTLAHGSTQGQPPEIIALKKPGHFDVVAAPATCWRSSCLDRQYRMLQPLGIGLSSHGCKASG